MVNERVRRILCDALMADEELVTPDARLVADLGAESIDLLDIAFRVEKEFSITAPRDAFFPTSILADARYVSDGVLTAEGLAELRRCMPHIELDGFASNPRLADFHTVLKVGDICRYVEAKLASGEATLTTTDQPERNPRRLREAGRLDDVERAIEEECS